MMRDISSPKGIAIASADETMSPKHDTAMRERSTSATGTGSVVTTTYFRSPGRARSRRTYAELIRLAFRKGSGAGVETED